MSLIPWSNLPAFGALLPPANRLFNEFFSLGSVADGFHPALDVSETDDAVVVRAEVPGVDPQEIEVSVHGDILELRGEKKQQEEPKETGYYRVERSYGSFRRSLKLPAKVDAENVEAKAKDGILTLTLPKREDAKPRRIKVKAA
ncbi:MAG: Hsp20/alpha crystallin family protein [Planctomycetota bacterium]|nr:Hsp20/alpha crystallin family protein [Planctomycetota bacterium]